MADSAVRADSSFDDLLTLLASGYRRRLLVSLQEQDPQDDPRVPADVPVGGEERDALMIRASHSHLPKLEEAGVIEWDRTSDHVGRGPNFGDVEPILDVLRDHADDLPEDCL
ncbi:DUF7344 domain-containing protein [Halorarum salinum]|uniref:ArsR family transcriptional regulator n=1 Tax=Halorarum salinum TaxID=2743089 RepID=A0A7D5QBU7_9EURY|nr:ArsR family transcriptional regulator [Halobaculum salinum]QLG63696.1 ArsR family transcriptional regulator [Halobaculum salinum]